MCGIAGVIQKTPVEQSLIHAMAQTLIHRGPDYTGYFFDEYAGFLHNRLSLLDLSEKGNQPFIDDEMVLLYNGEIYNHIELRKKYFSQFNFVSTSDTETLFLLLKHLGVQRTCAEIEGMFAFSIYYKKSNQIYLVRDRIGIKPLFYYHFNNRLIFSSELKGITTHFQLNINKLKILSAALGEFEYSRTHTAFENVSQLEPGTILHYNIHNNELNTEYYFRLTDFVDENEYSRLASQSSTNLLEEFDYLFKCSVAKMMLSDVPVGALVSGGIDSSLIALYASKISNINLYTADVKGRNSELKYAQLLADTLKMPMKIHAHYPQDLIKNLVETTWHYESPIVVHANSVPFQGVASLPKIDGIKPVLTGEGADELFLGYPRLLTKKWDNLIKLPFNITEKLYKKIPGLTRYLNLNKVNYNRDLLDLPFKFERHNYNIYNRKAFGFIKNNESREYHMITLEMLGRGLHSLLWRNDRMGMMHNLEARFPFLDEKLIKFAVNLPISMKIGKTNKFYNYKHPFLIDKFIIRKTGEKKLPIELINRRKEGFPLPGLIQMEVKTGFFNNGFIKEELQLSTSEIISLENSLDPYLKAKLACVEIWGKLYSNKEDKSILQENINRYLKINVE